MSLALVWSYSFFKHNKITTERHSTQQQLTTTVNKHEEKRFWRADGEQNIKKRGNECDRRCQSIKKYPKLDLVRPMEALNIRLRIHHAPIPLEWNSPLISVSLHLGGRVVKEETLKNFVKSQPFFGVHWQYL